jgi:hypothetical protein
MSTWRKSSAVALDPRSAQAVRARRGPSCQGLGSWFSPNSAKHTSHTPRITVRMPRHSGQSATISEGLMTGEYTSQVTPYRPPRGGSVNGSVSRDANVTFPLGWRFALAR